jgi:hypothetical protein
MTKAISPHHSLVKANMQRLLASGKAIAPRLKTLWLPLACSILLSQSVPADDLKQVAQRLGDVDFVSIFTTHPSTVMVPDYLKRLTRMFMDTDCHFHFTGYNLKGIKSPDTLYITLYDNIDRLLEGLKD